MGVEARLREMRRVNRARARATLSAAAALAREDRRRGGVENEVDGIDEDMDVDVDDYDDVDVDVEMQMYPEPSELDLFSLGAGIDDDEEEENLGDDDIGDDGLPLDEAQYAAYHRYLRRASARGAFREVRGNEDNLGGYRDGDGDGRGDRAGRTAATMRQRAVAALTASWRSRLTAVYRRALRESRGHEPSPDLEHPYLIPEGDNGGHEDPAAEREEEEEEEEGKEYYE